MKRLCIVLISLTVGLVAGWVARGFVVPDYPSQWDSVELGMSFDEAELAVPGLEPELREIKGFDQAAIDMGDRCWSLHVSYDDDGLVSKIEKRYVDRRIGFFNRTLVDAKP